MAYRNKKVGILGGGQLGRMMYEAVLKWDLDLHFMDKSKDFPVGKVSPDFHIGDFSDYEDVLAFGRDKDIVSIEIEAVNLKALEQLEEEGIVVHPSPKALKIIKDKGLQKMFYEANEIPSSNYQLIGNRKEVLLQIERGSISYPFVQKARTGGYDGKGVAVIKTEKDLSKLLEGPCLIEDLVDIDKEIGLIVGRNENGEVAVYDPVEMVFDEKANLVDYLFAPANIENVILEEAKSIAVKLIEQFDICGLLAVEYFLDMEGNLLVNEVAPRTHNSGHHTIEACITSQFEQHARAILNMPLGSTKLLSPAVMVNLLGNENDTGPVVYEGMEACLKLENAHLHFYGKVETKPSRKMGHATVLNEDLEEAKKVGQFIKENLKVTI